MWPFRSKKDILVENIGTKSMVLGTTHELGSFLAFGYNGAATSSSALNLYNKSTAVSIPINMIAEAFASIEPVIKKQGVILTDHPILDLLKSPSPFFSQCLFLETISKHYLITANAYVVALGNVNRPPLEIQPISPGNISEVEGNQGLVDRFLVSGNSLTGTYEINKKKRMVRYLKGNLAEINQVRGFSIRNNSLLRGQSPLISASAEVRQHILGNIHNASMLENGGRISIVFHFPKIVGMDDFNETKEGIMKQFRGPTNAGGISVIAGSEMDIKELGTNNKDMDFAKLQSVAKEAVALQYKIPLPLITTDASTFSNVRESRLSLYDDAVLPLADRIYSSLTSFLVPRYGEDPSTFKITYDIDSITALASRRNEELKLRRDLNFESVNEFREIVGMDPVVGGEHILVPATLVPIGTNTFAQNDEQDPEFSLARDDDELSILSDDENE